MKRFSLRTVVALMLTVMMMLSMTIALGDETPVYGGKLTLANANPVWPFWANVTSFPGAYAYTWCCVEPLGYETGDGGYQFLIVKDAIRDNENLTLTLNIYPNIKFHDGSELTADVLAWNIQTCIDSGIAKSIGNPVSVEVVGDYSVKLQYDAFSLFWEKLICKVYMYSKQAYDTYGKDYLQNNPIGTGPFYFDDYQVDKSLTFKKFDEYWGQPAYLDEIEYVFISDTTALVSTFINGQSDEVDLGNPNLIQTVEAAGYKAMDIFDYGSVTYLMFNSTLADSPWNNVDVRRAVCLYGVDWDGIAYAIDGDYGTHYITTAVPASNHWLDEKEWNIDAGYDPDRALKMLKEAGYEKGFETTLYCGSGDSKVATLIQSALADLNITVNVEFVPTTADWRDSGSVEGMIIGGEFSYVDWSSRVTDYYSETGLYQKVMNFSDSYREAYRKLVEAENMETIEAQLKQLNYIIHIDECYMVPVYFTPVRFFSQKTNHGWEDGKRYPASFNANLIWKDTTEN